MWGQAVRKQKAQPRWKITVESVYAFGREEMLEAAYEQIIPPETIQIKSAGVKNERDENRSLCESIKRKTGSRKND
jgi:hypothetical protein